MTDETEEKWVEDAFRMRRTDQIQRARMFFDSAHRDICYGMDLIRGITAPPHVPLSWDDMMSLRSIRVTIDSLLKPWDQK